MVLTAIVKECESCAHETCGECDEWAELVKIEPPVKHGWLQGSEVAEVAEVAEAAKK